MTEEETETGINPVVKSIAYIAETLTDNVAWFVALGFAFYLIYAGSTVPDWLIAIVGMGTTKYLKT